MTPDPLVGKVLAERFEILERIGEGGTGVVYKAKQLSVDRVIAIKVLGAHVSTDPSWVKRFHNEARAASRLDHPNTVRLIDFGQTKEGLLFIAMEFLHGRSLRQEIDQRQRLPPNRVLRIVSQMCASLGEAHNQGIIHRDIKPDNVYLAEMKGSGDFVKVLDFSVAKLDAPDAQVTRAGVVFGTPAYMSPEQGRGVVLDARSDIYAVGIVAYEMLTGKPPFDAKIPTEVVMMHLREKPSPLTSAPPQLAAIVRQQTAEELDTECQACFAELFPRQTPGSGVQRVIGGPSMPMAASPSQSNPIVSAPPPAAPPVAVGPRAPAAAHAEMKTMMAGDMQAPVVSRPPPAASSGPPPAASSGPPPAAPLAEQKTMMADMQAPVLSAAQQQAAQAAQSHGSPLSNQRTMAVSAPANLPKMGAGTQLLPDSAGVVAFAREKAAEARQVSGPQAIIPAQPAGALFWIAWVVLGIGIGLGVHFWLAHKAGLVG